MSYQVKIKCFLFLLLFIGINIQSYTQCTLTATSSGGNATYTQIYVLVDASNDIVAQNSTGTFTSVPAGSYQIHALNYDPADPPNPLPSGLIGMPISNVGSITAGCFNSDFLTDFVTRTCTNPACVSTTSICENATITATSSGGNAAYTQVYVLADDSGNFEAQNTTGIFPTTGFTAGETYHVHALNYDPANPPSPLPSGMTIGDPLTNITGGCFNADFLTDYVCFNIITCTCTPSDVCEGDDITATSSGGNAAYTQVYVLADDSGNFEAQNTTGIFPTAGFTAGETYHVHALNYDPANPPSPLPSGMTIGDPLTNITGGCFNADFLTDYVCFNMISCICTPTTHCFGTDIIAEKTGFNAAYELVYVLADDSGNFITQNDSGVFTTLSLTVGNTYHVHALNYDPADPPSPLPSGMTLGDPLSNITGGCFNSNFLTDFLCFEIECCTTNLGFVRDN